MAFQIVRVSSYAGSPGSSTDPSSESESFVRVASFMPHQTAIPPGSHRWLGRHRSAEGELGLHDLDQPRGDCVGLRPVRRLDHHPHDRLGAAGAQQHPPGVPQLRLGGATASARRTAADTGPVDPPTFTSTWGSRSITAASSASGLPVAAIPGQQVQRRDEPSPVVAWSSMIDVAGLLAAEGVAAARIASTT